MKSFLTLMHREWMQHRLGWLLLALVPLGLALLLTTFGNINIGDSSDVASAGAMLPALVALVTMLSSMLIVFGILWFTSLVLLSGVPRRDDADRSVEFWVSLPTGHSASLAAPLLVHLLVVPAAALLVGVLGGAVLSTVTVWKVAGFSAWLDLPWSAVLPALLAMVVRLLVGLPLATLWLLPLVLLVMLSTAWFRRWGIPLLGVGLGLGNLVLNQAYGITFFSDTLSEMFRQAASAMVAGGEAKFSIDGAENAAATLNAVPGWALRDLGHALANLASPTLLGGLLFSGLCFALLVDWRRRSV